MTHKPAPMVPEEIDLTDYPYMPVEFRRLFSSDTWVLGQPEEKLAAFHLWCESWHQRPAGSLPTDDRILAKLSGTGPRWRRLKLHALRGWVECSDGRLYHPVVAEKAMDGWERKRYTRGMSEIKARAGRKGAEATHGRQASFLPGHEAVDEVARAKPVPTESGGLNRSEVKRKGTNGYDLPDWIDREAWHGFEDMRKRMRVPLTDYARRLTIMDLEKLREQGQDPNACLAQSAQRGWRGVFSIKADGASRAARPAVGAGNDAAVAAFLNKRGSDDKQ